MDRLTLYNFFIIIIILQQLSITSEEVEELLIALILDEKISGQIDQVNQRLEIEQR